MSHLMKQPVNLVKSNISQGDYRSHFFDLSQFGLSEVKFNSLFFDQNKELVELSLLRENFSFAYLREDKLRTIDVYDSRNSKISFNQFLEKFGIKVNSGNLFKSGKYFSRIFRPVKYGSFYKGLDVYVNEEKKYSGAITDGISLISISLANSLGWKEAKVNMSGQFTLFYKDGLVKGHCVVSDKIKSDVVIYGSGNIKKDISLSGDLCYVTLEPVKLGKSLRLDIQSLLNLWHLFGAEQYLEWAYSGIEEYVNILKSGRLSEWLDNFDEISVEDYNKESWILRKAIWHKVDYRKFPGLVRLAWGMMRNSILRYGESVSGNPVFRIPVPGGMRGYLRIDLRNHDELGNFQVQVNKGEIEIDEYGNVWFSDIDIEKNLKILGGADMDDSLGIIPIEEGKCIVYRNPNQYGEYLICDLKSFCEVKENILIGGLNQKKVEINKVEQKLEEYGNKLLDGMYSKKAFQVFQPFLNIEYSTKNLLRTYTGISRNSSNIGVAANAEMIRSAIGIENNEVFEMLTRTYSWNLERIIDSTVKDGVASDEDMNSIRKMYEFIITSKIELPKSIIHRLPSKLQEEAKITNGHLLDQLLEAIKILVDKTDKEIVGRGSVKKGNRIEGWIDRLDIPVIELGLYNLGNRMKLESQVLMKNYNKEVAILIEKTNKLPKNERNIVLKERIEFIQKKFLQKLEKYSENERKEIISAISYEIYKSKSAVHDSILWINGTDGTLGTAFQMIHILSEIGEAYKVKQNGCVKREVVKPENKEISEVRFWTKDKIDLKKISSTTEVLIEKNQVLIGKTLLNLGDECKLRDGIYSLLNLAPQFSPSKNSYLNNSFSAMVC
ncbi:MAG: hypothetical protein IPM32_02440 [Ignavibacteriae bacterium]|nr:hypothetical protein [Ignavibacteriota bacterium]